MSIRMAALALPLVLASVLVPSDRSAAATLAECQKISPNHRPATADDAVVKNNPSMLGRCYNPNEVGINQTAEQAKQYLKTLRNGAGSCNTTSDESFNGLNDAFAVCAAQFLQAAQQRYGKIQITSAYRTTQQQKCVCPSAKPGTCAPAGRSNHERAVALDVWPTPRNDKISLQLQEFARANPQFGVCFPLGTRDRPHMILAGIDGGEGSNCAAQGITKACSGAPPSNIKTPAPVQSTPTNSWANSLRSALGMQQLPPPPPPMPSQPIQQAQSPLGAFNPAPLPQPTPVSDQITATPITSGTGSGTSVSDRLLAILNPTTTTAATSTNVGTSAPIVITGTSSGTVVVTTYSSATPQYGTGSLQPVGEQTFSSNDSGQQEPLAAYSGDPRFQQILSALRSALTFLSYYLTPFRNNAHETYE